MSPQAKSMSKFMWVLALLYVAEGFGQVGALMNQPLKFHLINDLNWNASHIQVMLNIALIPWLIKPLFGAVCDKVPILGSRYRSYLLIANMLAGGVYLWMMGMTSPLPVTIGLTLTSTGMSTVSAVSGAMLVARGKETGQSGKFVSHQWLWFWVANIGASWLGGYLCEIYLNTPVVALHYAALIVAGILFPVAIACWFLVEEDRAAVDLSGARSAFAGLRHQLRGLQGMALWKAPFVIVWYCTRPLWSSSMRSMWVVSLVVFVYYTGPYLIGTPFDVFVQKHHFDQTVIGYMNMAGGIGHVIGAIAYSWLTGRVSFKKLVYASCILGALSQAGYALPIDAWMAVTVNFVNGFCGMLAVAAMLTFTAEKCPDGSEGFTYGVLTTMRTLASPAGGFAGAYLFDYVVGGNLATVALVSAVVSFIGVGLLSFLEFPKQGGDQAE